MSGATDDRAVHLQNQVNDNLLGSGHCDRAAILDPKGAVLACSAGFAVPEGTAIAAAIDDQRRLTTEGLTVDGAVYFAVEAEEGRFCGKRGATGIVVFKSGEFIVIGGHGAGIDHANCRMVVEAMSDHLGACGG